MDERIRGNIELFRRLVPRNTHLYVVDKGIGADVFAIIKEEERTSLEDAYELTVANTKYAPGFAVLPIEQKRLTPAVKEFLDGLEKL